MLAFIIRRFSQSALVLLAVSVVVFVGIYAIGNPADILLPDDATEEERQHAIRALGLDKPLPIQFFVFLGNALKGDLGTSFVFNIPSIDLILLRLPATLELAFCALFIGIFFGIVFGMCISK